MPGLLLRTTTCTSSDSFSSPSPSPPPQSHPRPHPCLISTSTIHHRRTLSRANAGNSRTSTPPPIYGLDLGFSRFTNSHRSEQIEPTPQLCLSFLAPTKGESDAETWERMLALQREYRCYNSARVEAAVEALERGWRIEEMTIPSRLCLNLLNEELRAQIVADQEMRSHL